jgi:hypothetical protein
MNRTATTIVSLFTAVGLTGCGWVKPKAPYNEKEVLQQPIKAGPFCSYEGRSVEVLISPNGSVAEVYKFRTGEGIINAAPLLNRNSKGAPDEKQKIEDEYKSQWSDWCAPAVPGRQKIGPPAGATI